MLAINVRMTSRSKRNIRALTNPGAVDWAEAQALNRTAVNVRDVGIKRVAKEMGLSASKLRKRGRGADFRNKRQHGAFSQTRKANKRRAQAVLQGFGRPFNINRWKNKPIYAGSRTSLKTGKVTRPRGVQQVIGVTHKAWGDTTTIGGVWRLKNGAYMVRDGDSFRSVYGPGVTHVLGYPDVARFIRRYANRRFRHHFDRAMAYAFSAASHVR